MSDRASPATLGSIAAKNGVPPGPKGIPVFGVSLQFARDPLGFLEGMARKYGDIVRLPIEFSDRIFLNHPDWIKQVLVLQQTRFEKSERSKKLLGDLLGQGLLTSEGEFWRRQRRLAQPAFRRSRINDYAPIMMELVDRHIRDWRNGEVRDLAEEMMALTLEVGVRALFGTTMPGDAQRVGQATTLITRYHVKRMQSLLKVPQNWPTPMNRKVSAAHAFMDGLIYRIISDRQKAQPPCPHMQEAHGHKDHDVLSLLMSAMDEDGTQMTRKQLRDETITFFLAGHETTALNLAWTWLLLAENPKVEERLHSELRDALRGQIPQASDVEQLPYLAAVLKESLRLFPPAAIISRASNAPFIMGDYAFPAGTTVLMSQWVTHRDPRFFTDPAAFRPERWLEGLEDELPTGAYFPFGDGPRRCIGQGFALLDAMIVLGFIAQHFYFRLVPNHPVVTEQLTTLRPRYGLKMTVHKRG